MKTKSLPKTLLALCALFMLFAFAPARAFAYDFFKLIGTSNHWNYVFFTITDAANHYVSVTQPDSYPQGYEEPYGELDIPSTVTHNGATYTVTSIGNWAFRDCSGLTSVTIPNSVTSIGDLAFTDCIGMTSVTIGNSVTSIGRAAFDGCSGLTSFTIPNSVTTIDDAVFRDCTGLTSVTIGNSVTSIGQEAFEDCTSLNSVYYTGDIAGWCAISFWCNVVNKKSNPLYYANNLYIGNSSTPVTDLVIPASVTVIQTGSFIGCSSLTSVTIPDGVTSIGAYAFNDCTGLTSVTIPNSVISIGTGAFYDCSGLTSVTIGNSVTSIREDAFNGCSNLNSVYYTGDVAGWCGISFHGDGSSYLYNSKTSNPLYYGENLYIGNTLVTDLVIPTSVTSIKRCSFICCSMTSVTIPNSVTSIEEEAFYHCTNLTSITIPNSVTSIGAKAFGCGSSLNTVNYNATNCSILSDWLYDCNALVEINIGDNVQSIPAFFAHNRSSLTSVTIGSSVTSIGQRAFLGCTGVQEMYVKASDPPTADNEAFYGVLTNIPVYVPLLTTSSYRAAQEWSRFTNYIERSFLDGTVVQVPYTQNFDNGAFQGWVDYYGELVAGSGNTYTAELDFFSNAWKIGEANGMFNSHAYVTIGEGNSAYDHYWLVSRPVHIADGQNVMFSFDIAMSRNTGNQVPVSPGMQDHQTIYALITDNGGRTWHSLYAWRHEPGYIDLEALHPSGTTYSTSLSSYAGKDVYVAFYVACNDATDNTNRVHVDNVSFTSFDPTLPPTNITVTDMTGYSVKVSWTPQTSVQHQWDVVVTSPNTILENYYTQANLEYFAANFSGFLYAHVNGYNYTIMEGLLPDQNNRKAWVRYNDGTNTSVWVESDVFPVVDFTIAPTAVNVSEISGHSAKVSWTPGATGQNQWDVAVASSSIENAEYMVQDPNTIMTHVSGTSYNTIMEGLTSGSPYKAWVRCSDGTYTSPWTSSSPFSTQEVCGHPVITDVQATATTLFVSWEPGEPDQTNFTVYVGGSDYPAGYDVEGVTSFFLDVSNWLYPGDEYYIYVGTICSDNGEEIFSEQVNGMMPDWPTETVNDGTNTSHWAVINAYCTSEGYGSTQFVVPASQLEDLQYSTIEKLQFYCANLQNGQPGGSNALFEVRMAVVDFSNYSGFCSDSFYNWDDMSLFYDGTLSVANGVMTITPVNSYSGSHFRYEGGDLLIGIKQTESGSGGQAQWYGVTTTVPMSGYIDCQYDPDMVQCNYFVPKVTFGYAKDAYLPPTNLEAQFVNQSEVYYSWTPRAEQTATIIQIAEDAEFTIILGETNSTSSQCGASLGQTTLLPETNYYVRAKGVYGEGEAAHTSAWGPTFVLITPDACEPPASLQVAEVGPFSVNLSWVSDAEFDEVEYREVTEIQTELSSNFNNPTQLQSWTYWSNEEAGWTMISGGTGLNAYKAMSSDITGTEGEHSHWLITPQIHLPGTLTFEAWGTRGERLAIYVSTTGNDHDDFQRVGTYQQITGQTSTRPQEITVDLSSYLSGYEGNGYIAIGHLKYCDPFIGTTPPTYSVIIDNFVYQTPICSDWQSVGLTTENSMTVEGLTPGHTYQLRVRSHCNTGYNSDWNVSDSFTTVNNIVFEDDDVKDICVDYWDSDRDGELSYAEAEVVTSLIPPGSGDHGPFYSNPDVDKFNELQYFTGLTVIDDRAFAGCANLQEITLPAGIITIGEYAFGQSVDNLGYPIGCTNLHNIVLPEGLTTIGNYAFSLSGLESLNLPNSVTTIGQLAFDRCLNLISIYLSASVTTFTGSNPFAGCDLSFITVDLDNPVFDSRSGCNAIIQTATNTLVTGCKNTVIPEGVTSIGTSAFENATGLTSITLPSTLESIGVCAFMNCSGLTAIYANCAPPYIQGDSFANMVCDNVTVNVPCASVETYQNFNNTGQPWGGFDNIVGEDCQTTYTLASGWNWWAPFESNIADELMQALDNGSIVGDILINTQEEGFLRRSGSTWGGTLTSIEPGKMYKVLTEEGGSFTFNGEHPTSVTVELQPGYTWFGFIGTDGTDIATLLTPADGDQLIRLIGDTYTTYTYSESGHVWNDGTYNVSNLLLQRGRGYIYHSTSSQTKTFIMHP